MSKLLHIKGSRVKVLGSLPTNSFGDDGDIVLSSIKGKGAYLCAKMNGRWHVANKLEDLKKMERTSIRDLKVDKLRVRNATLTKDEYDKPVGDFTLDVAGDIELNADGGNITFKDDAVTMLDVETTVIKSEIPLMIKESADAVAYVASYGQIWVDNRTPNILMFTDDAGQDIHLTKNTAVWGGGFARTTGANGKWLGIPTGHQGGYISFGTTDTAPDVIYNPTTTADDLGGVIWQSIHSIRVTACRIWYGEGGSSNTRHILCLMRYDIDSSGTLSNGAEVAGVDVDGGSDDYTTLAFTDLTMTSDDTVTNTQVLIAMIYNSDLANAAMTAKCILEYQDLP